ncbi:MAG: tetratricopeptide repeat protein [Thermodesulfobacteriota bacterium]
MACVFYLAAVAAYVAARSGRLSPRIGYMLTGLAFLAGMLSKENVATVPLVLVLTELTLFRPDSGESPAPDDTVPRREASGSAHPPLAPPIKGEDAQTPSPGGRGKGEGVRSCLKVPADFKERDHNRTGLSDSSPASAEASPELNARRTSWASGLLGRIAVIGLITVPPFALYLGLTKYLHAMGSLTPKGFLYGITEYYHLSGLSPVAVVLTECKVWWQYLGMIFVPFLYPVRLFQAQTISVSLLDTPWTLPACAGLCALLLAGLWTMRTTIPARRPQRLLEVQSSTPSEHLGGDQREPPSTRSLHERRPGETLLQKGCPTDPLPMTLGTLDGAAHPDGSCRLGTGLSCFDAVPSHDCSGGWGSGGRGGFQDASPSRIRIPIGTHPVPAFGILFFFVTLLPESTLIPQYLFFGYRAILPMVGLLLVVGWGLDRMHQRLGPSAGRLALPAVMATALLVFGTTTLFQTKRWSPPDFWADEYANLPELSARIEPLTYIDVLLDYSDTLVNAGEPDRTIPMLGTLVALGGISGPSSHPAELGEYVKTSFGRIYTLHPVKMQEALLGLARAHKKKGDPKTALSYLRHAVKRNPLHEPSRIQLASALTESGKPEEAVDVLREAITFNPRSSDLHVQMGLAFKNMGKLREAIRHYDMALRRDPRSGPAYNNLAVALEALGHLPRALTNYQHAVGLMPDAPDPNVNLAALLLQTGKTEEALEICRRVLAAAPDHGKALSILGMALLNAGRPGDAMGALKKALKISPDDADLHNALGVALAESGNPDEAVRHFEKALQIAPDHPEARTNLSRMKR